MKLSFQVAAAAVASLLAVATSHSLQAQEQRISALDLKGIAAVDQKLETLAPDYFERKESERRKRFPIVVVIPGIMGSAIIDRNTGNMLWGEKALSSDFDPALVAYPSREPIDVRILESFDVLGAEADVYGDALKNLKSIYLSDETFINVFPYDWRQDNRISADQFNIWFCENRKTFEGRSLIIAAHSMGGLITKYWLKHFYNNSTKKCPDGNSLPELSRLMVNFIGVPHYGAPKALKVFSNGFYLARSGDSTSIFGSFIDMLDREWLANAINEYGFSFPSAYQLLPIYNEECFPHKSGGVSDSILPSPLMTTTSDGGTSSHEDIFSPAFWKAMKWPKTGRSNIPTDYYTKILPEYLKSAYNFLCELAEYNIPDDIDTEYFASNSFSTDGSYTFDPKKTNSSPVVKPVPGDETVPYIVAGNFLLGSEHRVLPIDNDLPHSSMLRSKIFWRQIEDEVFWAENRSQKAAIKTPEDYSALREAYFQNNALPPLPLRGGETETREFAIRLAGDILKEANTTPQRAFAVAKFSDDLYSKNILYSMVAESTAQSNPILSIQAANSITYLMIQNNYWTEAAANSMKIRSSPSWTFLTDDKIKLKGFVLNNDGWANLKTGNFQDAKASFEKAVAYGNKNAINGLNEIESLSSAAAGRDIPG